TANCPTRTPVDLTVPPPPALTSVAPDLKCIAQADSSFVLTGQGFITIASVAPMVTFTDAMGKVVQVMGTPDPFSCKTWAGPTEMMQLCTVMNATVPRGMLGSGLASVVVANPPTAGCSSTDVRQVLIVPPPALLSAKPQQV